MHLLTFDFEEWYQLTHRYFTGTLVPGRDTIFRQADIILSLLDEHKTKATFFVLGLVAEQFPELVRRLADNGHEIGSHGYAHHRVFSRSRAQFEEDTRRSKELIEQASGAAVRGYRAAEFSINAECLWALDVLAELGFTYDSSIFPIRHRRYGIPGFDPHPRRYKLSNGLSLVEIPLATVPLLGARAPVAGGGYFRVLPVSWLKKSVRELDSSGVPFMTYFHPYEFDPAPLDCYQVFTPVTAQQRLLAWRINFRQNLGRSGMLPKLSSLLREFRFTTCQEYLHGTELAEDQDLLSQPCGAI